MRSFRYGCGALLSRPLHYAVKSRNVITDRDVHNPREVLQDICPCRILNFSPSFFLPQSLAQQASDAVLIDTVEKALFSVWASMVWSNNMVK